MKKLSASDWQRCYKEGWEPMLTVWEIIGKQFTMSSMHSDKHRINSVILKRWKSYWNLFDGKDPNSGFKVDSPPWQCPCDVSRVHKILAKQSITKMDNPVYSPDLATCSDIGLRHFYLVQSNVMLLWGIQENDFQDCFRQWHHHLAKCVASIRD